MSGPDRRARWDFGDGSPPIDLTSLDAVAHSYALPGAYTATLVVSDGANESTTTTTVEVLPARKPAELSVQPSCGSAGDTVTLTAGAFAKAPVDRGWNHDPRADGQLPKPDDPFDTVVTLELAGSATQQLPVRIDRLSSGNSLEVTHAGTFALPSTLPGGDYSVTLEGAQGRLQVPCPQGLGIVRA